MEYPMYGIIKLFPYNFIPAGWLKCDGSTLPIPKYNQLFSLIGTQFGGDGVSTFKLPDLSNALPLGATVPAAYVYCIANWGDIPKAA